MKPAYFRFVFVWGLYACSGTKSLQVSPDKALLQRVETAFVPAAEQYKLLAKALPPGKFPKNYDSKKGAYEFSGSEWWCSGFYPGTLLYLYEQTKDTVLYNEAIRMLALLEKEKMNTGTHDLGFMMFCSFGYAARIAPKPEYRDILLQSAKSLSTRFSPTVGSIKSWNSKPSDFL